MSHTNRIVETGLAQHVPTRATRLRKALRNLADLCRQQQGSLPHLRCEVWMMLGQAELAVEAFPHAGELLDFVREKFKPLHRGGWGFGHGTPPAIALAEVYDAAEDLAVAYKAVLANA